MGGAICHRPRDFKWQGDHCSLPDGSKEGWDTSNQGDDLRQRFIEELAKDNFNDGSSPWDWVEVGYGEYGQKVLRGNNKNSYTDEEYATAT